MSPDYDAETGLGREAIYSAALQGREAYSHHLSVKFLVLRA